MFEELTLGVFSNPWDVIERGSQRLLSAQLLMIGDRLAVRLVAQSLEQEQLGAVLLQNDWVLSPWQEHALWRARDRFVVEPDLVDAALGEADDVDVIQPQIFEHGDRLPELPLATIDDDQVGRIILALGDAALPVLVQAFPGKLAWTRRKGGKLPAGRDLSPVARALVAFGERTASYTASLLGSAHPDVRFYAILIAAELVHPDLTDAVAERIHDEIPGYDDPEHFREDDFDAHPLTYLREQILAAIEKRRG